MTKTRNFWLKSRAKAFAVGLEKQGFEPQIYPRFTFGPRNAFHLPWGWQVVWLDIGK